MFGHHLSNAAGEAKSADWKVAVFDWMKQCTLSRNAWLSERLRMGVESGVSRYIGQLRDRRGKSAGRLLRKLDARIKY